MTTNENRSPVRIAGALLGVFLLMYWSAASFEWFPSIVPADGGLSDHSVEPAMRLCGHRVFMAGLSLASAFFASGHLCSKTAAQWIAAVLSILLLIGAATFVAVSMSDSDVNSSPGMRSQFAWTLTQVTAQILGFGVVVAWLAAEKRGEPSLR